jgi:uncharacterized protein (DUF934 family)
MALLKNGSVIDDIYTDVRDADVLPKSGALLVSLGQWQNNRADLLQRDEPLGVWLRSDEKAESIADDIGHFGLIALEFPAFGDGRAYSTARLLRSRYAYAGELRAVGDVLLEQLHFMNRVGFDAYDIRDDDPMEAWETAAADISVWYQPATDARPTVLELRHGRGASRAE